MSTLSGIVSKGEKGKSKFQSLDINSLYRESRGESLEQHQQKNTLPRKHGMQSLGKVPSARRPPANLPSLKSETSSSDPAVSLVPSGGSGWATTKDPASPTVSSTTTTAVSALDTTTTNSPLAPCAPGTAISAPQHPPLPGQQGPSQSLHPSDASNKSSWSAIMSRSGDGGVSGGPQQQQALSRELNAQYGPGPSLRPQTEGSWIQGGSRTGSGAGAATAGSGNGSTQAVQGPPMNISGQGGHSEGPGTARQNLGQSPAMAMAPVGQHNSNNSQAPAPSTGPNLHQYRGLIPPFMYRGNFTGGFPPQFAPNVGPNGPRPRFNYPVERFPTPHQQRQERDRLAEEEIVTRPIIKEEDLTRMDDIARDAGWSAHDDIDYNQKLTFSDDEQEADLAKKDDKKDIAKEEKNEDIPGEEREKPTRESRESRENRDANRDSKEARSVQPHRPWSQSGAPRDFRGSNGPTGYSNQSQLHGVHPLRGVEEDEASSYERRRLKVEVASVVERARQRKEEEEKRFQELTKQAAAKKLQDLEQKLKEKQTKLKEDERGPSSEAKGLINVPPVPIPVPEWERERENRERESRERERSRTSSEDKDEKIAPRDNRDPRDSRDQSNDFRSNDRQGFLRQQDPPPARSERDRERERERDQRDMRDREHPAFSSHFKHNLPPRFQKQHAERSGSNYNRISPNAERSSSQSVSFSQQYDPAKWAHAHNSLNSSMKPAHTIPPPPLRRTRADSDVSSPMDEERPPSRDHRSNPPPPRDDRYHRSTSHRSYEGRKPGYDYPRDDYGRGYRDYEFDERHSREPWERDRHSDEKDRESKDSLEPKDNRDRDIRDNRSLRDNRDSLLKDKKDYDNYMKESFDDREHPLRDRPEGGGGSGGGGGGGGSSGGGGEWREERREDRANQERQLDNRREPPPRDERLERGERPQRPDSRDSRTSRESKTSIRDDDSHKSRDCGSSWANDISDYEEKKQQRDFYHEDMRERDRERERDRRLPPGPVTKEKIEADELKSEKRNLTQLKRGVAVAEQEKKDSAKESSECKKESDICWSRKSERTGLESSRSIEKGENIAATKVWADAVSPTFEKEDGKLDIIKDEKHVEDIKQSMEKLSLEKDGNDEKEQKDEKREKNVRNRTGSGSLSSRSRDSRGGRQWGGNYNSVYIRSWRGPESRGRIRGSNSRRNQCHTDSEDDDDEVSVSTESGKEEKRSTRSPKPSQKLEKEDRNREVSRREDKRSAEYSQSRNDKRVYDGKPSREGFAPSGEPSRRGRGSGFRIKSSSTTGSRMEGYGPPSSKSPFSSERNEDKGSARQNPPTPTPEKDANSAASGQAESSDDKIIAKQQALTAGITGRRNKSPNQQPQQGGAKQQDNHTNTGSSVQKSQRKDDSRTKRNRSRSRRGRDNRDARFRGSSSNVSKQTADMNNEDWETTSENSEEHIEESKESRGSRNKPFPGRGGQGGKEQGLGNSQSRRSEQSNRDREKTSKASSASARAPGAEKRNAQNAVFTNQRSHSGNIPPLMQNAQAQNGRSRSQGSAGVGGPSVKSSKESTVNRIDEIKLSDPNLVNQALNDMNKKSQGKDKKVIDPEADANNYAEDGSNVGEDKLDSDGFQEVRSKKNVKESRHSQKDEVKPAKRDKEKDRERDRSKSKSNGSQATLQQVQNIPPLLGQAVPQPAIGKKPFERPSRNPKLPPRLLKLAKQQQQMCPGDANDIGKLGNSGNYSKDSGGPAPPPSVNAWDKPFTNQLRSNSPSSVSADIQLMSGLTAQNDHSHEVNEQITSGSSSQRNSPNDEKSGKKEILVEKNVGDVSSPPVQTLIFENTNYSKTTKTGSSDLAVKSKFSNHIKSQQRVDKRGSDMDDDNSQMQHQQQSLSVAFSNKPNDLMKDKSQEPIQMPLSFNKNEDNADMKLDFNFDSDLSQLTDDKSKSLGMARSMHMTGGQSTISPSTAELNLKIASVKKVWENVPMPTVVEHEDGNVVSSANSFPQAFESNDVDDSYNPHQQYSQNNMKNEITTSTNVCKLVPPQVKPQQQSSGSSAGQPGSTVPGPSPIGAGQSPIGHPPASLQGPLSPPPFNSTGQPSHMNYQEFPQYPASQPAQYGNMSAIPSPPAVLFNTGSGQLPAQAGGLYGAFQLDQSRSPFTQYAPYGPSLQNSFSQQNVYLQQPPPPPHAPNAPTPDMYQNNLSQYRLTAAAAPPFGQNQQLSNNPNTVLISSSSNSLMSASVKPSSQPIGAIGTKAPHFQAPSAPQPNQLYIPYDPNQVLGVSGSYMGNSQLVQRPGPNVQPSANSYYSATSDVFPGSQTGFYQPGGATQQTGTHYGLQGFGQHNQSLATGSATPVGLQNYSSGFLSNSGLQITAAAAAAQQYRNPAGAGLPPANAPATFLSKHQAQEPPRQLKSPSGNQDVLASVFSSTPQIPSPKSRNCKQPSSSQQPQPSPPQHHKYQQYQGVSQSALVLQQNVRGMGMPPRAGIQPSQQQRYPPPIQRPVVPFPPGPNPNNPTQQQPNCMPTQQQQTQISRHRPNLHQQQQQRNMKMQQQYYSSQGNVKMDSNDKNDSHNEKISDGNAGNQPGGNKSNVNQQDVDNKEEVNQQNE